MENRQVLALLDALLVSRATCGGRPHGQRMIFCPACRSLAGRRRRAADGRGNPFPIPTVRKIPPCQQAARTV